MELCERRLMQWLLPREAQRRLEADLRSRQSKVAEEQLVLQRNMATAACWEAFEAGLARLSEQYDRALAAGRSGDPFWESRLPKQYDYESGLALVPRLQGRDKVSRW